MSAQFDPHDLHAFVMIARHGSLSAAARQLRVTPAALSKRLAALEQQLGVRLITRSTRSMTLTDDGELFHDGARGLLEQMDSLHNVIANRRAQPSGLLRVNTTLGFGRRHIAQAVSEFTAQHPQVQVQLHLTDRLASLSDDAFEVLVRVGVPPEGRYVAKKIANNRRWLVATPKYLAKHGMPKTPQDLRQHNCVILRDQDGAFGVWKMSNGKQSETVKVNGSLSSNDGEVVKQWCLNHQGIILRSEWHVAKEVAAKQLKIVLPSWELERGDIFAEFLPRQQASAKVTAFVDYLSQRFDRPHIWREL